MPIQLPSPRRIALFGLLLAGLIMLADGVVRIELARAVNASLNDGARMVAHLSTSDD